MDWPQTANGESRTVRAFQFFLKPFADAGDGVMIGMLLSTMQEKVLEPQVEGSSFGLESTVLA